MPDLDAFSEGPGQHDSESSGTRYLLNNEKGREMRLPFSSFLKSVIASTLRHIQNLFSIYVLQIVVQSVTCIEMLQFQV